MFLIVGGAIFDVPILHENMFTSTAAYVSAALPEDEDDDEGENEGGT